MNRDHLRRALYRLGLTLQYLVALLFCAMVCYLIVLAFYPSEAEANESQTWMHVGAASYHFDRDKGYNEINPGLGIEHQFNATHSAAAGFYRNSERRTSAYIVYGYTPIVLGPVKLGALAGAANGYSAHDGRWFPVVLPAAMAQWGRFGANLTIIPSIKEKIDGGIALQFKWRF